jgi:hypothetical protein
MVTASDLASETLRTANGLKCLICGMTANIDPSCHTERYAHIPEVRVDGERLRFDFTTYTFRIIVNED